MLEIPRGGGRQQRRVLPHLLQVKQTNLSHGMSQPIFSPGGLIFGIVNIVGNFGTVFCDQAYWQSSVAAKPLQVILMGKLSLCCISSL